jgi:hypothetical protein
LRRLIPPKLGFDVRVGRLLGIHIHIGRMPTRRPSRPRPRPRCCLSAHALANPLGLFEQVIEEFADIIADSVYDGEDFFKHIANEIRSRHPEILGEASDVLGELLGNTCMKDPLFAVAMTAVTATAMSVGAAASAEFRGIRIVGFVIRHGLHCDPL